MTSKKAILGLTDKTEFFEKFSELTVGDLELVGKTKWELEDLLQEKIDTEDYEKCALIRDELLKRAISNN